MVNKIKVKKAGLSGIKNNKLTLVLAGTVASIFLLIFLKAWLSDDESPLENLKSNLGLDSPSGKPIPEVVYEPGFQPKLTLEEAKKRIKLANSNFRRLRTEKNSYQIQQERLLKEFQNEVHLTMNFPGYMDYIDVEMEDDFAAIYGSTTDKEQSFAVVATSRKANVNQAISFLKEEKESFPMLRGHELLPDKSFQFNPPDTTGLKSLTVIPGTEYEGRGFYAVFAPRADEKGNYLFMMEAKKEHFEENEDGFEQMLDGIKAQP